MSDNHFMRYKYEGGDHDEAAGEKAIDEKEFQKKLDSRNFNLKC